MLLGFIPYCLRRSSTVCVVYCTYAAPSTMTARCVVIGRGAYWACRTHAMTTQEEEVMGLLIGRKRDDVVYVEACLPAVRTDKRPDRVEISEEQLSDAMIRANAINEGASVVGWYHSHPNITVHPSHVDVAVQRTHERSLDALWIGLIFNAYAVSAAGASTHEECIAFQSRDATATNHGDAMAQLYGDYGDDLANPDFIAKMAALENAHGDDPYRYVPLLVAADAGVTTHDIDAVTMLPHNILREINELDTTSSPSHEQYGCECRRGDRMMQIVSQLLLPLQHVVQHARSVDRLKTGVVPASPSSVNYLSFRLSNHVDEPKEDSKEIVVETMKIEEPKMKAEKEEPPRPLSRGGKRGGSGRNQHRGANKKKGR